MTYKDRTRDQWLFLSLRARAGLSAEDVASSCGTTRKTVYRYERGDYKFETLKIKKVKNFYEKLLKNEVDVYDKK